MSDSLAVIVGNKKYEGWESIAVSTSMDSICSAFDVSLLNSVNVKDIYPGIPIELLVDDEVVCTGFIDKRNRKIDDSSGKTLSFSGRDKTCDLVDCSVVKKSGSWTKISLLDLCKEVCKPFDISVSVDPAVDLGKIFKSVTVQDGESVFALIERLSRQRSVLPLSDAKGNLLLTVAQSRACDDVLSSEGNIKVIEEGIDYSNRFSDYTVKGQDSGGGNPWNKAAVTGIRGTATDNVIKNVLKRYRPLIIQAESNTDAKYAQQRASWEAVVRFGRSLSLKIDVQGWRQSSGILWQRNYLVDVFHKDLDIDATFLIDGCSYKVDDSGGHVTSLSLSHKDALMPEPDGNVAKKDKSAKNPWLS